MARSSEEGGHLYDESATDTLRNSHVVRHGMKREYSRPGRSLRVDLMILLAMVGLTLSAFAKQNYEVAVVPSDDPALVAPVERTQELSTEQIEAMVRRDSSGQNARTASAS